MENAGEDEGGRAGDQRAKKARRQPAHGDQRRAKPRQGKDQRIKAGNGLRQQKIARHAQRQRVNGAGHGALISGRHRGQNRIEKGNDPEKRDPLKEKSLGKKAQHGGAGIQQPLEDRLVAGKHHLTAPQVTMSKDLMIKTSASASKSASGVMTA